MNKQYSIAISIVDKIDAGFLYANGISQNIVLLYELFELLGHEVCLIVNTARPNQTMTLNSDKAFVTYTLEEYEKTGRKLDLFLEAGQVQGEDQRLLIHQLGAVIVSIHYGCSLIMDMENILYKNEENAGFQHIVSNVDYIWISPHHAYHQSYLEILYSAPCEVAPFIWDPHFISKKKFKRQDVKKKPNIYVMEPNLSVVKNALVPLAIIEALYRDDPDTFHHAFIVNGDAIKDKSYFLNNIVTNMPSLNASVVKDKVFFSDRCKFEDVFTSPDILLSHHWNNGLNYLSLEAIYYNIPLVHNSEYFKEVGYFYEDFNVYQGRDALKNALKNHRAHFPAHQQKNKAFLKRFSIYNKKMQANYREMLDRAFTVGKQKQATQ